MRSTRVCVRGAARRPCHRPRGRATQRRRSTSRCACGTARPGRSRSRAKWNGLSAAGERMHAVRRARGDHDQRAVGRRGDGPIADAVATAHRAHVEDVGRQVERRLVAVPQRGAEPDPPARVVASAGAHRGVARGVEVGGVHERVGRQRGQPTPDGVDVVVARARQRRVDREPVDGKPGAVDRAQEAGQLVGRHPVAAHGAGQLDDDRRVQAGRGQLVDVALRTDREDGRAHADGQLAGQRRRQHQRPGAIGRQAGQLVDRAHRQLARCGRLARCDRLPSWAPTSRPARPGRSARTRSRCPSRPARDRGRRRGWRPRARASGPGRRSG